MSIDSSLSVSIGLSGCATGTGSIHWLNRRTLTGSSMTCKVKLVWEDLLTLATGMQNLSSGRTLGITFCNMVGPVVLRWKIFETPVTSMTCNLNLHISNKCFAAPEQTTSSTYLHDTDVRWYKRHKYTYLTYDHHHHHHRHWNQNC